VGNVRAGKYGGMKLHNFHASLAASHLAEDLPFWEEVYRKAFPDMRAMINHREDGDHQRAGIDRSIILGNSKQILVDEKTRWKVYEDIALEVWSDKDRLSPGWVCKPLLADYIAYAIAPLGRCYLLPVIQLQEAWRVNGGEWSDRYFHPCANNELDGRTWVTESVAVPVDILFSAIGKCLRVSFPPVECGGVGANAQN